MSGRLSLERAEQAFENPLIDRLCKEIVDTYLDCVVPELLVFVVLHAADVRLVQPHTPQLFPDLRCDRHRVDHRLVLFDENQLVHLRLALHHQLNAAIDQIKRAVAVGGTITVLVRFETHESDHFGVELVVVDDEHFGVFVVDLDFFLV